MFISSSVNHISEAEKNFLIFKPSFFSFFRAAVLEKWIFIFLEVFRYYFARNLITTLNGRLTFYCSTICSKCFLAWLFNPKFRLSKHRIIFLFNLMLKRLNSLMQNVIIQLNFKFLNKSRKIHHKWSKNKWSYKIKYT